MDSREGVEVVLLSLLQVAVIFRVPGQSTVRGKKILKILPNSSKLRADFKTYVVRKANLGLGSIPLID